MAFIDKYVVYAHRVKVHRIVFPLVDFHFQFLKFGCEVLFALLQTVLHLSAAVAHGGLFQHFKVTLHIGQFFGEYVYHGLFRLRYFGELVVRQNDTVPVVVLDFREYLFAVGRGEILLARIKHLCRGVSLAERVGYFVNIGFQADNERFLHQSEAFHFVSGNAHYHRLARAYLVPADTAAVLLNHPNGIFL